MELSATILTHQLVRLEPFEARHQDGLSAAAHADVSIFRHMPYPIAAQGYDSWFDTLRAEQAAGRWAPFAVIAPTPPPFTGEVIAKRSEGAKAPSPIVSRLRRKTLPP